MNETQTKHTAHITPRHEKEDHTTRMCVCDPISTVLDGVTVVFHKDLREMGL